MTTDRGQYHVLLIGVDAYDPSLPQLHGCVNDIDAIQRIILDQAKIPASRVKRIASPQPKTEHETTVPTIPATIDNIRAGLRELASDKVKANDRVFIYYAGHGGRVWIEEGDREFFRESLVTSDGKNLFDLEFNYLMSRIVSRTDAVTVILDCCQSAGATRGIAQSKGTARCAGVVDARKRQMEPTGDELGDFDPSQWNATTGVTEGVDQCQVVAACLNHEVALEEEEPGEDGDKHGYLTRSVMNALSGMSKTEIRTVTWARIWHRMRESVETAAPDQHLWISGNLGRAVLGGPPVDGDVGLHVTRRGDNRYEISSGTLSGLTVGARLAIYGEKPSKFPPLDSAEDLKARASDVLLKVTAAKRGTAIAKADGPAFELPPGARGRLVKAGSREKLRCAVVPADDKLVEVLAASPLLKITRAQKASVRLERREDGNWVLTDDLHGSGEGEVPLCDLGKDPLESARKVMEHYRIYSLPIRMAERCTDLPGALRVQFLACPEFDVPPTESEQMALQEARKASDSTYRLADGDSFCIRVHNHSDKPLRVVLLDSAGSGRVISLGDQIIDANETKFFWYEENVGSPFWASVPEGAEQCIDRLVAVGTTALEKDLKHLASDTSFADLITRSKTRSRDIGGKKPAERPPVEQWTATQAIAYTILR